MLSEKIKELVGETDKLVELKEIMEEADSLETQIETNKQTISEQIEKIQSLRDTNMKLFLSQTAPEPKEPEPEKKLTFAEKFATLEGEEK